MNDFDVVIVGGGSAGYACALRASQLGLSAAVIEKDQLGGTCLHRGCIPTKALLHAGAVADQVRDAPSLGVGAQLDGIDIAQVHAFKSGVVDRLHRGLVGLVDSRGVRVISGEARLVDQNAVDVDGSRISGRAIVLATGGRPRHVPGVDVDGEHILTSDGALDLQRVPRSAIVLGGGVIGCEFASLWRSFGANVTVLEALPRLLATEDVVASQQLERAFRRRKINLQLGKRVDKAERTLDGVRVTLESGDTLEADTLLVAVGRDANTDGLGLEDHGVLLDGGLVVTDERLRTSVPRVYAIGDLVAGPQLAHRGYAHGIFVAEEIAGLAPEPVRDEGIPRVTFAHPEVASVGLTEAAARAAHGDSVTTVAYDLGGNGRSQILGSGGAVKLVRHPDGNVLGVHIVAAKAGEMIGEAQLVTNLALDPEHVARLIHAHPTQHEALGEAHQALVGRALHGH